MLSLDTINAHQLSTGYISVWQNVYRMLLESQSFRLQVVSKRQKVLETGSKHSR